MIAYTKHKDIDKSKWDKLIDRSYNENCYAYSWYLDEVCPGWDALIEDDYSSVMPVTRGKKYFLNYVISPMFAQQLGLFSMYKIDQKRMDAFMVSLPKAVSYIEINLNYENDFSFQGFSQEYRSNYELNLNKTYSELRKNISENTRRNIKKALAHELLIEKNADVETVIQLFKKNKGEVYAHIKQKNYVVLSSLAHALIKKKLLEVWYVKDNQGTIYVGGFFIIFKNRIVFLFSGRTEEAKNNGAVFFLFDQLIREYAEKNIILDFAGSNDLGVARMYKSFGAEEKKYLKITKNNLPFFIKWLKK